MGVDPWSRTPREPVRMKNSPAFFTLRLDDIRCGETQAVSLITSSRYILPSPRDSEAVAPLTGDLRPRLSSNVAARLNYDQSRLPSVHGVKMLPGGCQHWPSHGKLGNERFESGIIFEIL